MATFTFIEICNPHREPVYAAIYEWGGAFSADRVLGWAVLSRSEPCLTETIGAYDRRAFAFAVPDGDGLMVPLRFRFSQRGGGFPGMLDALCVPVQKRFPARFERRGNPSSPCADGYVPLAVSINVQGGNMDERFTWEVYRPSRLPPTDPAYAREWRKRFAPPKPTVDATPTAPSRKAWSNILERDLPCHARPGNDSSPHDPSATVVSKQKAEIQRLWERHCRGKGNDCQKYVQSRIMEPLAEAFVTACERSDAPPKPCVCESRRKDLALYRRNRSETANYPKGHLTMFERIFERTGDLERHVAAAARSMPVDDRPRLPPAAGLKTAIPPRNEAARPAVGFTTQ
ncbi:hypothetical protein [Acuticoccus sediminis]|uniref:hypothetical protein n=1 Tax=Acuticoccus sediminis TaxID=2184697 RepID=UPI0011B940B0|nr:hypothetical protein [Acuticoccus sediminis]